ncbi:MAG: PKD domain-containing protein [Thermodesulfobacteriota bacterium]
MMKRKCFMGTAIFFLCSLVTTSVAFAGPVKATWADPSDGPHLVISGEETTLKAVAESESLNITYQWSYGDGTPDSGIQSVVDVPYTTSEPYGLEIAHTYTGKNNTQYTATVTVWDNGVLLGTDTYTVKIKNGSGNIRKKIGIEMGLWYIHKEISREPWLGAPTAWINRDWDEGAIMSTQTFIDAGFLATGSPDNPYTDNVQRMVNSVTSFLGIMSVADKDLYSAEDRVAGPAGMIDGLGVYLTFDNETEFGFGPALKLIATAGYDAAATPVVWDDSLNFTGDPAVSLGNWTYHQIAQQMVDWIAWAQVVGCSNDYYMRNGSTPSKVCDPVNYPVESYSRGGWPFWVEGWGVIKEGNTYHENRGDGTFSDASLTNWTLSGVMAAEANLGLVYPDYLKPEAQNFLLANLGSEGEVKFGAGQYIKDIGRAGMGLTMMSWMGLPVDDVNVQAQKNFISNNWNYDNWNTDQYYQEYDTNCDWNPVAAGNINCYSHFSNTETIEMFYYVRFYNPDGTIGYERVSDGVYQRINILAIRNIAEGLNSYTWSAPVPAPEMDLLTYQERYVDLLLLNQHDNGSWHDNNWGWTDIAGTGWAVQALLRL